jgi:hypothetical protein
LLAQPGDIAVNDVRGFVEASSDREQAGIAEKERAERRLKEAELEGARLARETAEKDRELATERAAAAERRLRSTRRVSIGAAATTLVIGLLCLFAFNKWKIADQKTEEVEEAYGTIQKDIVINVKKVNDYVGNGVIRQKRRRSFSTSPGIGWTKSREVTMRESDSLRKHKFICSSRSQMSKINYEKHRTH